VNTPAFPAFLQARREVWTATSASGSRSSGLAGQTTISGPAIKWLVDNTELDHAQWACPTDCFSAGYTKSLTEGLGELEIRPEPLRYVICATRDLVEDASVDVERWVTDKAPRLPRHCQRRDRYG